MYSMHCICMHPRQRLRAATSTVIHNSQIHTILLCSMLTTKTKHQQRTEKFKATIRLPLSMQSMYNLRYAIF